MGSNADDETTRSSRGGGGGGGGDFNFEPPSTVICVGTVGAVTDAAVCFGEFGVTDMLFELS